jgi:flagellar motor protein MotB
MYRATLWPQECSLAHHTPATRAPTFDSPPLPPALGTSQDPLYSLVVMSKRRRQANAATHTDSEVWPAYVDVLSAAFVFVLLTFAALLTRDVADAEQRQKDDETVRKEEIAFAKALSDWFKAGNDAVKQAAEGMANDITPVGLPASCTLPDAAQLQVNPTLVAAFSEQLIDKVQKRHPVTLVCTFSESELNFPVNQVEPDRAGRDLVPKLQKLARTVVNRHCSEADARSPELRDWCASGIEVVGHTDCRPLMEHNRRTNWELSSDRAGWVLRQMISDLTDLPEDQHQFRTSAAGRADREPRHGYTNVPCDQRADAERKRDRRVEVLIYLRTKPLDDKPEPKGKAK